MSETFYNNNQIIILNFNQRVVNGIQLNEFEMMMYEQACRLHEAAAKNLRLNVWDKKNKELERQQEDSE